MSLSTIEYIQISLIRTPVRFNKDSCSFVLEQIGGSKSLFWREKLNLLRNGFVEIESFSLWTWPLSIPVDSLGNAENFNPAKIQMFFFKKSSPS